MLLALILKKLSSFHLQHQVQSSSTTTEKAVPKTHCQSERPKHLRGIADVMRKIQGDGSFRRKVIVWNIVSCMEAKKWSQGFTSVIQLCYELKCRLLVSPWMSRLFLTFDRFSHSAILFFKKSVIFILSLKTYWNSTFKWMNFGFSVLIMEKRWNH